MNGSARVEAIEFLRKVNVAGFDTRECWAWTGCGKGNGYGHMSYRGKNDGAHRVSYQLFVGPIPEGIDVCHSCDNRWCVNPYHLFVGTRRQNMEDMKHKGRGARGARKHLKEAQVQEITRRLKAGVSRRTISETMDVNYSTIGAIARGKSYVRITE